MCDSGIRNEIAGLSADRSSRQADSLGSLHLSPAQNQWWFETATAEAGELYGYTRELSLPVGDPIELRLHGTVGLVEVQIRRDDGRSRPVFQQREVSARAQATEPRPYRDGCGWQVGLAVDTKGWEPGPYLIRISAEDQSWVQWHHWIALRPPRLGSNRLTLVVPTCTWNAYNGWGGASSYDGIAEGGFSAELSFDRPFQRGTFWLPAGAPRNSAPPYASNGHVAYPWTDWAFSHGVGKHYASAGWATFERNFFIWAEANGYGVDLITQHDLHFESEILFEAGPLIFAGHDEYWTWEMRDAVDRFVDAGGQVARLAGNFLWQVRLSADGLLQTCFKERALTNDPVRGTPARRHLLTYGWDFPEIGYPAAKTFGCSGARGMYAGFGGLVRHGPGGMTVYRPEHWMLDGTELGYGDVLGTTGRIGTYEVDGLDIVIRDGLPYPTGCNGIAPESASIVAMCLASNVELGYGTPPAHLDVGDRDRALIASIRHGEVTAESLDSAGRGCGVMGEYRRADGRVVFAAASEWVNGLRLGDPWVERVTHNILRALSETSAG